MTRIYTKKENTNKEIIEQNFIELENWIIKYIKDMHLIDREERDNENNTTTLFAQITTLHNTEIDKLTTLILDIENLNNEITVKLNEIKKIIPLD